VLAEATWPKADPRPLAALGDQAPFFRHLEWFAVFPAISAKAHARTAAGL
jgi:hypothetical protein